MEGVRRDVRVANLSLLNTPWYIKQLKNDTPHGAAKVNMSLTDDEIDQMTPVRWDPQEMSIPVPPDVRETIWHYGFLGCKNRKTHLDNAGANSIW